MIRFALMVIALAALNAPAQTTAPASPLETHRRAVELMRRGQFATAAAVLDPICKATAMKDRSRPAVLDRAICGGAPPLTVGRAPRQLTEYLALHSEEDELATNVLGSSLNIAADRLPGRNSATWQAAYREWERRQEELEKSHPG